VVKHAPNIDIDKKGKDSWKIFESGADVVIASPEKIAIMKNEIDDLDEICAKYLKDYDLVLTEGFNLAGKDRIVIVEKPSEIERFKRGRIVAVVSDADVEGYRCFRRDEVEEIVEFIVALLKDSLQSQRRRAESQVF
jgi:molybdopterin-guanine dinucleotide biosynthesis protein B